MLVYFSEELKLMFIVDDELTIRKDTPKDDIILMEIDNDSHIWLPRKDFETISKEKLGKL